MERRLKAKCRARKLVDVRWALAVLLTEQGWSVREVTSELCRPHSTVVHFVQTHKKLFTTDGAYKHLFSQVHTVIINPERNAEKRNAHNQL